MNLSIKIWLYYTVMDLNVKANIIKTLVKNKNTNALLLLLWIKNELQLKKVFAVSNFLNNHYLLSLQRKINLKIGASSCYYYYLILMLILTFKYHMYIRVADILFSLLSISSSPYVEKHNRY